MTNTLEPVATPTSTSTAKPRTKDKLKLGVRARATGEAAKKFISKNKAALIAAGVAGAAGTVGGYAMGKNRSKSED